jgi:tetratricopeptide (TPR) repeat protein
MEYQQAIRHLRNNEFAEAIALVDALIANEPDEPGHYRFRADLHRLSGDLPAAMADYQRVVELNPESGQGYVGLAEVHAQQDDYRTAREFALSALEREPRYWLNAYNLGLIADRLEDPAEAIEHLEQALRLGLPHSRYRLLVRLWLARNSARQGQMDTAQQHLDRLRREAAGLHEWHIIFESEQAAALRGLLEDDIRLAQQLVDGSLSLEALGNSPDSKRPDPSSNG